MKRIFFISLIMIGAFISNAQINFVEDGRTHVICEVQSGGETHRIDGNSIFEVINSDLRIGKKTPIERGRIARDVVFLDLSKAFYYKEVGKYHNLIPNYKEGRFEVKGNVRFAKNGLPILRNGEGTIEITKVVARTIVSGKFELTGLDGVICRGIIENVQMKN